MADNLPRIPASSALVSARPRLSLGAQVLRGIVYFYRWFLSPLLGPACRFYPSCSTYALAAIQKYGAIRGIKLSLIRLTKCHPWHPGGVDSLP